MRIMTYNIQYGKGRDGFYDIRRIAEAVAESDIVGLQEIEAFWERSGGIDQVDAIVEHLAGTGQQFFSTFGATIDIHRLVRTQEGERLQRRRFGNAILSRWPILSARTFLFPTKLTPLNAHSIQRGVTEAVVDCPSGPLRIYTSHLSHLGEEERLQQARFVLDLHRNAAYNGPAAFGDHPDSSWLEDPLPPVPVDAVFMGDFNTLPHSEVHAALTGAHHPHYGSLLDPERFVDAWLALGLSEDEGATLYGDWDSKSGTRIDYIMVSASLAGRLMAAEVKRDVDASDHQPLLVTLAEQSR